MSLPRGIRNNNPLNIRKGNNWLGELCPQTDAQFEQFASMEMGIRAGFIILRNYMTGFHGRIKPVDTISGIIKRWAPAIENATESYIRYVSDKTQINRYQRLRFSDRTVMVSLVSAMIDVECGSTVPRSVIESAYDLV